MEFRLGRLILLLPTLFSRELSSTMGECLYYESSPWATEQRLNSSCMAFALKVLGQSTDLIDFSELTWGKKGAFAPHQPEQLKFIGCFTVTSDHEPLEAGLALRQAALFPFTVGAKLGCKAKQAAATEALDRNSTLLPWTAGSGKSNSDWGALSIQLCQNLKQLRTGYFCHYSD